MRFTHPNFASLALSAAVIFAALVGVTHHHGHDGECGCASERVDVLHRFYETASDRTHVDGGHSYSTQQPAATHSRSRGHDHGPSSSDRVANSEHSTAAPAAPTDTPAPQDHEHCAICQLLAQANATLTPTFDLELLEASCPARFELSVSATVVSVAFYDVRGPPTCRPVA